MLMVANGCPSEVVGASGACALSVVVGALTVATLLSLSSSRMAARGGSGGGAGGGQLATAATLFRVWPGG